MNQRRKNVYGDWGCDGCGRLQTRCRCDEFDAQDQRVAIAKFKRGFDKVRRALRRDLGQDAFGFADVAKLMRECFGTRKRKEPSA
ncbi:MAG: hypothetical protein WBL29_05600 [Burkholderiales bacterium]